MAKNTQRDRVWIAALREDEFTKHDIIDSVDAGSRTVHDVLKTMVDADLLTETDDRRRVDRGDSYMYTDVTVYTSDDADESDSSTTKAPEPDMSDIDNGEINRLKEEIGVSNGDVPAQPHGSTDEKPDTPASDTGETVESDSKNENENDTVDEIEIPEPPFGDEYSGAGVIAENLTGIGRKRATALVHAGYESLDDLHQASKQELTDANGIGENSAKSIKKEIAAYVIKEYEIPMGKLANTQVEKLEDIFNVSKDTAKSIESVANAERLGLA